MNDSDSDEYWKTTCKNYTRLSHVLPSKKRIIAIGDIHGDLEVTKLIFKNAGLIDTNLNWIAEPSDTIVVQVGDQLDSCRPTATNKCGKLGIKTKSPGDLSVFKFFYDINKKAQKKGGHCISLLGNHELMNVLGNLKYNSKDDLKSISKFKVRKNELDDSESSVNSNEAYERRIKLFERGSDMSKFMACTRNSAIIIGKNLFLHAGILPQIALKYKIEDINRLIRTWLIDTINIKTKNRNIGSIKDILFNNDISPFWNRVLGSIPKDADENECEKHVYKVLKLWKINNMVIGHTPTIFNGEEINAICNNSLWKIDNGLSHGFDQFKNGDEKIQYIEILNDNDIRIRTVPY
tara:strand:+ start:60 stop:1109 length:1050 start_codon:yes stop_codon:yes gene_type:complete